MGCIETIIVCKLYICLFGLTLTWDVLKRKGDLVYVMAGTGLTLTWDVLKRNGRPFYMPGLHRLTLTWDVLKPNHVKETLPAPI